jgi:hypothetical protein
LGISVEDQPLESSRRDEKNNFNKDLREMGCEGWRWMGTGLQSFLIKDLLLVVLGF